VMKPRALGGSIGVVRVDSERDLERGFTSASNVSAGGLAPLYSGVVIEEYLEGKEYSVDCVSLLGETFPLVVAEKVLGVEPYFEEVGHIVPALETAEVVGALAMVREAHRVLGLDDLATCAEFRLTASGPRLIEINARIGGDLMPLLGDLALGIDLAVAAADVAMGTRPRLRPEQRCVAAVRFFYPRFDVELHRLELGGSGQTGLVAFEPLAGAGAQLRLPPGGFMSRLAYAIVSGETRDECMGRLDEVERDLVVHGRAL
jgi:biotin carboxylase